MSPKNRFSLANGSLNYQIIIVFSIILGTYLN